MKAIQNFNEDVDNYATYKDTDSSAQTKERKEFNKRNLVLNLGFAECAIWFFVMITLPPLVLLLNPHLLVPLVPLLAYLEVTALIHWCPLRFAFDKLIIHKQTSDVCDFAKDLNIPVKAI